MFGYLLRASGLAQRPHVLGLLGLGDLISQGFETLRPHFGGTLDVEGYQPTLTSYRSTLLGRTPISYIQSSMTRAYKKDGSCSGWLRY